MPAARFNQDGYTDDSSAWDTNTQPIATADPSGTQNTGNTNSNSGVNANTGPTSNSGQPSWVNDPQYAGMDPALKQIYINSGQTPAGRGTGFADWQYWQGVGPSQYGRLTNDIAGTGTDQTTGTPWATGAWQKSGSQGGIGAPSNGATNIPSINLPSITGSSPIDISGIMGNVNGLISQLMSPSANINTAPSTNVLQNVGGQSQALVDQLTKRADQSLNVDPNDPVIRNQLDAFNAQQDRQSRNYLNDLAESSNPYATGANQYAKTQMAETNAQASAGQQAGLMANELQNRRAEIQNSLSELGSVLTSNQQMALQDELGKLNAQLQNRQLQGSLALGAGNLGLGFGQLGLAQQQQGINADEFAAQYGLNATQQGNYWDALRSGLING